MRRRVVPALIALLAAALAAWRRTSGRVAEHAPALTAEPATALPEPVRQLQAAVLGPDDEVAAEGAEPTAPQTAEPESPTASPTPRASAPPADGPRFVSIPWTLVGADEQQDQQELPIRFTLLGGRMELDRIDVRETDSQVFVTVLARYEPTQAGRAQPNYGVARDATLRLAKPLGDRALVHAPDQLAELTGRDGG